MPTKEFSLDDFPIVKANTISVPHSMTLYGRPGSGKTVLAASIVRVPGYERTLLLDTEAGSVAVGQWYPEVDVLPVPTAEAFNKAYTALVTGKLVERKSGKPYQAVIIDTLDKAQERQLDAFAASPAAKNQNGVENPLFKWSAVKQWVSKVADGAHQADFLTIFVVHSEDYKNEDTGRTLTTVQLQGSSRFNFPSVSDAVGLVDIVSVQENGKKVEKRVIDFRPNAKQISKQRFASRLDKVVVSPTMSVLFDAITETPKENA